LIFGFYELLNKLNKYRKTKKNFLRMPLSIRALSGRKSVQLASYGCVLFLDATDEIDGHLFLLTSHRAAGT
jgi:hypothetical protein